MARRSAVVLLIGALSAPLAAQWSPDPASNLLVAGGPGEQAQPKLVPTADGGFYVSWFDNAQGGYDVRLQRLDVMGVAQWPPGGVLVAAREFTSTQDYGLDVDAGGNAVLAFRLTVAGQGTQAAVARIAPDGTPAWPAPVPVSSGPVEALSPRIAATADGGIVAAWSRSDGGIGVARLDAAGQAAWPQTVLLQPAAGSFLLADLRAAGDDVVLAWQAQASFNNRQYWAQKLAGGDGAPLWGASARVVMDASAGAMPLGYFPVHRHDGEGGAVFVWQFATGVRGEVAVQHLRADGSARFPANGLRASLDTSRNRYAPTAFVDGLDGAIVLAWRETNAAQSLFGVHAQRVDAAGQRVWGPEGIVLQGLGGEDRGQIQAVQLGGHAVFSWAQGSFPSAMPIRALALDSAGGEVWTPAVVDLKTGTTDGGRLVAARSTAGFAAFAWQDAMGSFQGDILAQNLNPDGSLGRADVLFADDFEPLPP
ncbi:MAG: hypothetical protein KF823_13280 [Xanthomonadales bacterium]|nr:hypothetical protein [Xanthomonadales bacterium]